MNEHVVTNKYRRDEYDRSCSNVVNSYNYMKMDIYTNYKVPKLQLLLGNGNSPGAVFSLSAHLVRSLHLYIFYGS